MRKKLAAVLLCMCMVLTLLPVSASAAGVTELWVGGVQIGAGSSTTGTCDAGTVTYIASTNTLKLENATITGAHDFGTQPGLEGTIDSACIYYTGDSVLTIELVGNNTITGQNAQASSYGIFAKNAGLKFTGSGSLTVSSAAITCNCQDKYTYIVWHWSVPIYASGNIEIDSTAETFFIVANSGGADDLTYPIFPDLHGFVLNGRSAVYGTDSGKTTAYTATSTPSDLNGKKYMKIGAGATPAYDISISPAPVTFTEATEGYDAVTPQTVTVTNSGTAAAGELYVSLSGDSDKFTLSTTTITIGDDRTATFTVTPKTGLSAGTHTATVKIMKSGVFTKKLGVSFTVKADDQTPPTSTTPTVTITYENGAAVTNPKVGETLYAKVTSAPSDVTITGYTWKLNDGNEIKANCGTDSTYTLMEDAKGLYITLGVSFSNGETVYANSQVAVAAANSSTPAPNPATPTTPATGTLYRVFHVDAEKAESPKTVDTGVMLYAALSLVSLTGTAWWSKKRK